ncbi:redoxin domain-containing protein [Bacillus shivajii]|uniref:redoxin domain-containing protein n=1 Tax=Bacillus shivajii TaxID=1983719 RepID=UPI001CFB8B2D|nr:redoxin domain-containing protein [Bacillus shivajii]UCZ53558.1 redoxin domain-containing protein [Bacillus shivajii]
MKKWILSIVLFGMIGWTLYESIDWESSSRQGSDEVVPEEAEFEDANNDNEQTEKEQIVIDEDDIGLDEGNYAPDFTLETLDGETMNLSDFRGQKVMINFWATWCPPCRAEMPDMQEVYENHDIQIIAVNLTETEPSVDQVKDFRDDFGLTFPILLDHDIEVAGLYEIQPIPTSYMIDTEGRVQSIAFGALNKEMMVQRFENID